MRNLALSLLVLLRAASLAAAHDPVRDPVCGMMVDPEHAAGQAEYLGKKYYFCQAQERDRFVADPAQFVSVSRFQTWTVAGLLIATVDPASPAAVSDLRIRVALAPRKDSVADETAPLPLLDPVVHFYDVDRDHPATKTSIRLQPLDGNAYGALRTSTHAGETRFIVDATTATGVLVRLTGFFTAVDRPGADIPDEPFSMARQHEVMRRFGRRWESLRLELTKEKPDRAAIGGLVAGIEDERKRLPLFSLHVNEDAKGEFVKLGDALKDPLAELGAMASRGDFPGAKSVQAKLETESCVKCHLKFRWDVVRDLSRFPRVEGAR